MFGYNSSFVKQKPYSNDGCTEQDGIAITLQVCIREVLGSNLFTGTPAILILFVAFLGPCIQMPGYLD
jgi:hypothetical protein